MSSTDFRGWPHFAHVRSSPGSSYGIGWRQRQRRGVRVTCPLTGRAPRSRIRRHGVRRPSAAPHAGPGRIPRAEQAEPVGPAPTHSSRNAFAACHALPTADRPRRRGSVGSHACPGARFSSCAETPGSPSDPSPRNVTAPHRRAVATRPVAPSSRRGSRAGRRNQRRAPPSHASPPIPEALRRSAEPVLAACRRLCCPDLQERPPQIRGSPSATPRRNRSGPRR